MSPICRNEETLVVVTDEPAVEQFDTCCAGTNGSKERPDFVVDASENDDVIHDSTANYECCPICYEEFLVEEEGDDDDDDKRTETSTQRALTVSGVEEKGRPSQTGHPARCTSTATSTTRTATTVTAETTPTNKLLRIGECGHTVCSECLFQHVQHSITVAKCVPIPCPRHADPCKGHLSDSETQRILERATPAPSADPATTTTTTTTSPSSESLWKSYLRLVKIKGVPRNTIAWCPQCEEPVLPPPITEGPASSSTNSTPTSGVHDQSSGEPDNSTSTSEDHDQSSGEPDNAVPPPVHPPLNENLRVCPCEHVFCAVHGDAHPLTEPCAAYEARRSQSERRAQELHQTEKLLAKYTKPCSHCGVSIQRYAGCDHVVCPVCGNDMCFRCGTHVHLLGVGGIRKCRGCQQGYVDHRYEDDNRYHLTLLMPMLLPFIAVYIAVAGLVMVVTLGYCCCWCGGRKLSPKYAGNPPSFSCFRGLRIGFFTLFLPLVVLANDYGYHTDFVDCLQGIQEDPATSEMPTWDQVSDESTLDGAKMEKQHVSDNANICHDKEPTRNPTQLTEHV